MGLFAGKPLENGERYVLVWGRLTRAAKVEYTQKKGLPKVSFCVAYDRKTFMNCLCLGEGPHTQMAACLEKGDLVLCAGTWSQKTYTNARGESKKWSELRCEMVLPQQATPFPGQGALGDEGEPDAFESAEEYQEEDYQPTI